MHEGDGGITSLFESESTTVELEKKLIAELKAQPTTYFNVNTLAVTATTSYWHKAFIGLMKKAAITIPYGENLDGLVMNVLKYISKGIFLDITPIIQSEACQTIILDKKDYYKPIIVVPQEHSSELR